VIRLDAIGDALALTPLLAALREREIPVDLVMSAGNASVFTARAARAVSIAPFALRDSRRANLDEIARFGARLRERAYSDVLVPTEDPAGYRLARATAAPRRVGFVNGWGKPFKTLWAASMLTRRIVRSAGLDGRAPHECEVLWQLGSGLAGDVPIPRDPHRLRPLLLERDATRGGEVAFQVTDKWERLGIDFQEVVRALQSTAAIAPLRAIAAGSELAYARRIARAAAIEIDAFDSLAPWKAAIASAAALVAPDSGALHVAGMVGTPTVAVFPPVHGYALQLARWAPWAAPYRAVRADGDWPAAAAAGLQALLAR